MIADFVIEKMSRYIAGGMKPATAARFTRGELAAVYKGNHHSRDNSGAWQVTPPPEALGLNAAMAKCEEAIRGIWDSCIEAARKVPPSGLDGKVPENPPKASVKRTGLEGLKDYGRKETA
jgi:hypothetical protein